MPLTMVSAVTRKQQIQIGWHWWAVSGAQENRHTKYAAIMRAPDSRATSRAGLSETVLAKDGGNMVLLMVSTHSLRTCFGVPC